jgi:hypothetical protein
MISEIWGVFRIETLQKVQVTSSLKAPENTPNDYPTIYQKASGSVLPCPIGYSSILAKLRGIDIG